MGFTVLQRHFLGTHHFRIFESFLLKFTKFLNFIILVWRFTEIYCTPCDDEGLITFIGPVNLDKCGDLLYLELNNFLIFCLNIKYFVNVLKNYLRRKC